jgi:hypothetical protein
MAGGLLIIGDHTPVDHPDIHAGMRGLVPRDIDRQPVGYSAVIPPSQLQPYAYDDMVKMIADMEAAGSRGSDILRRGNAGKPIPSLDQNGQGYCWDYGPAGAMQAVRAKMGLPYKKLSGHANACLIKGYRDEGGWGALGLEYMMANGIPDCDHWPEKSMSRSNDTPAMRANAKLYVPDIVVADLASPVYNRDLSYGQQLRILLDGGFTIDDHDWWAHCIFACDVVNGATMRTVARDESGKLFSLAKFDQVFAMNDPVTKGLSKRDRNSWTDNYGDMGFFILTGSKAVANNSVAILTASAA